MSNSANSASSADSASERVARRLAALRGEMARHDLHVYLVPSADEHQNEYLPAHRQRRQAVSGFSGSAGDLAVLADPVLGAQLFVDSRYHLQADQETDPALVRVHKLGAGDVPELSEWLRAHEADVGALRVGYDPFLLNLRQVQRLAKSLQHADSQLLPIAGNLVDAVWEARPTPSARAVYALPEDLTGEPVADKLARVREAMAGQGAAALVLTKLDEVAWLTNLRGADIPYNPVFEGYLLVERGGATCFTDNPVPQAVRDALQEHVAFRPYAEFAGAVQGLANNGGNGDSGGSVDAALWLDPAGTTQGTRLLAGDAPIVSTSPNPVVTLKAVKNPVELAAGHRAHLHSGLAKVRSFSLLGSWLAEGRQVSEAQYAALLEAEYAREEGFSDLSFNTIAAFGPNAAIVHYGTPDAAAMLTEGGMLLVDSGIQLRGATTDDTRTIAIGIPTAEQRERFTQVLRGHIRLAMQIFPEGTTGQMLDALARSPLWNVGADYGHGTGHGVGAFLNVHEGPHSVSPRSAVPLEPGMVVSNEPGYYRVGWGGIRIENLYVVEEALGLPHHPAGKRWLRFAPLTLIPFDHRLIAPEQLMAEEARWLADYHALVESSLAPHLEEPHRIWLHGACAARG